MAAATSDKQGLYALVLHGGAFLRPKHLTQQSEFIRTILNVGKRMLAEGKACVDVAETMVALMEDSGFFVAGRGSGLNSLGVVECDASIMIGNERRAGAVACVTKVRNPIKAARKVMQNSKHVLLVGPSGEATLADLGVRMIDDPTTYYEPLEPVSFSASLNKTTGGYPDHGTVGAVVVDKQKRLCAATSTGGTNGKLAGRVGDTPIIGAGTYADNNVAISCTGIGEYFLRTVAAHEVASLMKHAGLNLHEAACKVLYGNVAEIGGKGGIIAVDRQGNVCHKDSTDGMVYGYVTATRGPEVGHE